MLVGSRSVKRYVCDMYGMINVCDAVCNMYMLRNKSRKEISRAWLVLI